ncbi:MAG: hypothetical protein C0613_04340 [Desulfobulbaceae bacterium]|nr:MAG: hypothetical protein C0613_04340 [Desulfobulbaceae bacterium]
MKQSQERAAAVIGMGAVTPAGWNIDAFSQALFAGESQFREIRLFDAGPHRTRVAAELDLPAFKARHLDAKVLSRTDIIGLAAAGEALAAADLLDRQGQVRQGGRTGLVCATAGGAILGLEDFFRHRYLGESCDGRQLLTSFCLSALATNIAKEFQISGPRTTTATVCSSSGVALAVALEMLRHRPDIDHVLVAASESLSQVTHGGFNALRSVAADSCRPFAEDREGLVLGEAGCALVLCRPELAPADAPLFTGYGLSTDLYHFTAPDPQGEAIRRTLETAMADGDVQAADIDYINCHGTGTPKNDAAEVAGIKQALGARSKEIPLSSTKSMFGHTLGAASLLEAIATLLALKKQEAPPTAHLRHQDKALDLNFTPLTSQAATMDAALSNSFAFGGSNISLVFKRGGAAGGTAKSTPVASGAVITGIGVVSPLGIGSQAFKTGVAAGSSALSSLAVFGPEWQTYEGGLVDLDAVRRFIPAKRRRRLNRLASFLTVAVNEALDQAALGGDDLVDCHLAYGSAFGCSSNVHNFYSQLLSQGATAASPQDFMLSVTNAPAALVAQHLGMRGPVWVFVEDEVSWEASLHWAVQLVESGGARQVVVAAADEISDSIIAIHDALGFLEQPGYYLGEGAVAMVVEAADAAAERDAQVLATVRCCSTNQDVSCDPTTFTWEVERLAIVAQSCLVDKTRRTLQVYGPANGFIDDLAQEALAEVLPAKARKKSIRHLVGDAGMGGGMALAAGLLAGQGKGQVMTVTASRGGIQAATLVERSG